MMFQGSENAGKMEHIRLINSSGGLLNGTTHYDITNYFESVPSNALERVLWLEADRMRALKVDDENLRNQRDVVKEEVRVNVMNQPYGGFPWLDLPPVAFRNWPNAHNFYGDFADLDAATLADVRSFFHTYYAPNNAVLADGRRSRSRRSVRARQALFRRYSAGAAPPRADVSEPPQTEERRGEVEEKFGPLPAIAIGYTLPKRETRDWYAAGILDRVLHGGRAGRVIAEAGARRSDCRRRGRQRRTFRHERPYANGLAHLPQARIHVGRRRSPPFDEVIREVQDQGIAEDELDPVKVKFRADYYSMLEGGMGSYMPRFGLMHYLACFTLFDGDPHRVNTILDGFSPSRRPKRRPSRRNIWCPQSRRPGAAAGCIWRWRNDACQYARQQSPVRPECARARTGASRRVAETNRSHAFQRHAGGPRGKPHVPENHGAAFLSQRQCRLWLIGRQDSRE
jgi:zinc protease